MKNWGISEATATILIVADDCFVGGWKKQLISSSHRRAMLRMLILIFIGWWKLAIGESAKWVPPLENWKALKIENVYWVSSDDKTFVLGSEIEWKNEKLKKDKRRKKSLLSAIVFDFAQPENIFNVELITKSGSEGLATKL